MPRYPIVENQDSRLAWRVLFLGSVFFLAGTAGGDASTLVLQQGTPNELSPDVYQEVADVTLFEAAGTSNYGAVRALEVDNMQAASATRHHCFLLRFDLTLLAGKKITKDATLSLVHVNPSTAKGDESFSINIYQVSAKNADWVEGTGSAPEGTDANPGEPSWKFKKAPDTAWAGAAGLSTPGVDFETTPVATVNVSQADGNGNVVLVTVPADLMQKWVDHPETNGGLLFVYASGDRFPGLFRSSDWSVVQARPKLEIEYGP